MEKNKRIFLFEKHDFEVSLWEKIKNKIMHFSIGPVSTKLPV
jgi:hypothetical protein